MKTAVLACLLLAAPAFAATPFAPADIWKLSQVTDPVLAADGRRVLFTRMAFEEATDRRTVELWLAHIDEGGKVIDKRLLVGRDVSPNSASFSPDGSRIAYLALHLGRPQVHVMVLGEGVGRPLTTGDLSPQGPVWSPDGNRIAFTGRVLAKPPTVAGMPEKAKGTERAPEPKIISDLFWRSDAGGESKPGARHLFVVDAATGATTQLTAGEADAIAGTGIAWTRDGAGIIGSVETDRIGAPAESDLYRFDARTAGVAPVRLTARPGSEESPEVSPDGRSLAFIGAESTKLFYAMPEAWVMPLKPGGPIAKVAPSLDRPVNAIRWRADSGAIYALYHDAGVTRVGELPLSGAQPGVRVPQVGGTRLYLPSAGGGFDTANGTFVYTSSFTDRPAGLGVSRGGAETGAIDFNATWAAGKAPARIEEVRARSKDGREIQGWLAFPPGFVAGKRHPLILDIHGGPNTDYGPFFSVTHALYAAAGYVVLFTNPRGSIGYGSEFANLITGTYPGEDHDDLMAMVDAVAARPFIDGRNLFIGGGSGGGVLTLNAIGREPEKFRGAVALRPVVDWTNQATTSDGTAFFAKQWMGAMPWDDPEGYRKRSPFYQARNIKTPTMLITGESDFRTPISQTEMMFGALKLRGVDAVMVRLPEAGHGMGRPSQWLQSVLAPIAFFDGLKEK